MNRIYRLVGTSLICFGLCAFTGCARISSASTAPTPGDASAGVSVEPLQPMILSESMPVVADQACAGNAAGPAVPLPPGTTATAVTICSQGSGYLRGSGYWGTVETRVVPAENLSAFVAALATPLPPFPPGAMCAGVGWLFPTIKVSLADETTTWAEVPSDGCSPSQPVLQQLDDFNNTVTPTIARTVLQTSEKTLLSGCTGAKPRHPTRAPAGNAAMPALEGPEFSVCVYTTDAAMSTTLSASGTVAPFGLEKLTADLTPDPPTGCAWPNGSDTDIGSFLTLVPRPAFPDPLTQADPQPLLNIASIGCHVVIDDAWEIVGWIDDPTYLVLVTSVG
ncbi:hypothetical protein EH165_00585 [Nakamurella antarctica]|uniref:Septum formation-related domain-containing protein n=1 Tax=Nakamurella antarctica TaxID=1902245 RepID=A0A3G8ZS34_9ACTN|nr:hypothetical protein [Nakamurella antarctica]AZI56886.1 hypothetical protein EH165_00585 [Nakamurella antarctica]